MSAVYYGKSLLREEHQMRLRFCHVIITSLSLLFSQVGIAAEQTYPNRPIRLVIPWPTGGGTDLTFRLWAPQLAENLGQQVVIDNRAGASSIIGLDIVAKSPPNGYTIGASNIAFGANPFLIAKMPFDSEKDLLPVSLTAMVPMVLTVHPSVPSRSVKDLIALAKSKPGAMSFSSAGNASASHLVTELFLDVAGAKMLHVPYKGGGPQVVSTVGGETAVAFIPIPNSLQHIRSGRLIALGLSTLKRDSTLRDVPTIAEAIGIPDFEVSEWHGVVVPAATPPAVIQLLHREIAKVLARPDIRERLEGAGAQAVGGTPEEMTLYIKREFSRWSKLIKAVGIRVD
jgi:tripartite-type tricarboxylate transporter receptor subunit TctC